MLAMERISKIKELVINQGNVKVSDLAVLFEVTEETIRRDLQKLEDENFLVRSYGGAFINEGVKTDVDINLREFSHVEGKQKIARACLEYIKNGDSIFLDASTTSVFIANSLINKNITVVTNSLKIANILLPQNNINMMIIGGSLNRNNMSMLGRNTELNINNYFFDSSFISCRAISMEYGVMDSNEQQAEVRKIAIEHANKVYLVADYTKLGHTAFTNICRFDKVDYLIIDKTLSDEWQSFLTEQDVAFVCV